MLKKLNFYLSFVLFIWYPISIPLVFFDDSLNNIIKSIGEFVNISMIFLCYIGCRINTNKPEIQNVNYIFYICLALFNVLWFFLYSFIDVSNFYYSDFEAYFYFGIDIISIVFLLIFLKNTFKSNNAINNLLIYIKLHLEGLNVFRKIFRKQ